MTIDNLPGAIWPILFGAIYAGLQVFVSTQWPEAPPAMVLGIMTALGVAMGVLKVLWPETPVDVQAAPRGMAGPVETKRGRETGKFLRFLV